jgi:hypothetical protein
MSPSASSSMLHSVRDHRLRCAICDEVIGVYEPIMVLEDSQLRHTSWLNEPTLGSDHVVMHHRCALDSVQPESDS